MPCSGRRAALGGGACGQGQFRRWVRAARYAALMNTDFFSLELQGSGIAHLQLHRPERLNTLAPAFFPALRDAVQQLNAAGQARVLVISSTGKHFCAGMDLEVFAGANDLASMLNTGTARARLAFQDGLRQLMACFDALENARFPVIAAVQGGCIGGGLDLAAACDLRLCSADAFFSVQEIHIGMAADLGVLQRLPKIVPPAVAREMAYTGARVGAERALAVGLVNAVWPDAAATLAAAMKLAGEIAAKSPLAIAGSKRALNYAVDHPTADALDQMALLQSAIFDIGEMGQAIAGWKAKQAAAFAALDAVKPV
jgi:enoyl-CoA hydratase